MDADTVKVCSMADDLSWLSCSIKCDIWMLIIRGEQKIHVQKGEVKVLLTLPPASQQQGYKNHHQHRNRHSSDTGRKHHGHTSRTPIFRLGLRKELKEVPSYAAHTHTHTKQRTIKCDVWKREREEQMARQAAPIYKWSDPARNYGNFSPWVCVWWHLILGKTKDLQKFYTRESLGTFCPSSLETKAIYHPYSPTISLEEKS